MSKSLLRMVHGEWGYDNSLWNVPVRSAETAMEDFISLLFKTWASLAWNILAVRKWRHKNPSRHLLSFSEIGFCIRRSQCNLQKSNHFVFVTRCFPLSIWCQAYSFWLSVAYWTIIVPDAGWLSSQKTIISSDPSSYHPRYYHWLRMDFSMTA
jgi:hypothetical protein